MITLLAFTNSPIINRNPTGKKRTHRGAIWNRPAIHHTFVGQYGLAHKRQRITRYRTENNQTNDLITFIEFLLYRTNVLMGVNVRGYLVTQILPDILC